MYVSLGSCYWFIRLVGRIAASFAYKKIDCTSAMCAFKST